MSVILGKFGQFDQVSFNFCKDFYNKIIMKRNCEQKQIVFSISVLQKRHDFKALLFGVLVFI